MPMLQGAWIKKASIVRIVVVRGYDSTLPPGDYAMQTHDEFSHHFLGDHPHRLQQGPYAELYPSQNKLSQKLYAFRPKMELVSM
mmetsp:Transcript_611/g.1263  ORF Transcript_611/g.1263 Transcript_611/m.1263 type:complete len:84 (+) Transcript_611:348-599(+)